MGSLGEAEVRNDTCVVRSGEERGRAGPGEKGARLGRPAVPWGHRRCAGSHLVGSHEGGEEEEDDRHRVPAVASEAQSE